MSLSRALLCVGVIVWIADFCFLEYGPVVGSTVSGKDVAKNEFNVKALQRRA